MVKEGQRWPKMEMPLLGLEPSSDSLENSQISPDGGAQTGALPSTPTDFQSLAEAFLALPEAQRAALAAILASTAQPKAGR